MRVHRTPPKVVVPCDRCGRPHERWKRTRLPVQPLWCSDECRFWSFVAVAGASECWPWTGSLRDKGYGQVAWGGRPTKAHRVAFLLGYGRWPDPNALHRCDNPGCCNPAHLFEGTTEDNNRDMWNKGRHWLQQPGARQRLWERRRG